MIILISSILVIFTHKKALRVWERKKKKFFHNISGSFFGEKFLSILLRQKIILSHLGDQF